MSSLLISTCSELMSFIAERPPRSVHPHYDSGHASTNQFDSVVRITASRILIDSLQPSIIGLWLRATRAGVTPAYHQTISSLHVHHLVRVIGTGWNVRVCESLSLHPQQSQMDQKSEDRRKLRIHVPLVKKRPLRNIKQGGTNFKQSIDVVVGPC